MASRPPIPMMTWWDVENSSLIEQKLSNLKESWWWKRVGEVKRMMNNPWRDKMVINLCVCYAEICSHMRFFYTRFLRSVWAYIKILRISDFHMMLIPAYAKYDIWNSLFQACRDYLPIRFLLVSKAVSSNWVEFYMP